MSQRLFRGALTALVPALLLATGTPMHAADGLDFVQSRTAMNDIYMVTFLLVSLLCLLNRKVVPAALFLGVFKPHVIDAIVY